jgi:hypothetical protein
MSVFSTKDTVEAMREYAFLSPAEFLRPFVEVQTMNNKSVKTIEKQNSFKFMNFRLNVIDAHKIDNKYYKDSEYSGLF